jgi:hypothetical protein
MCTATHEKLKMLSQQHPRKKPYVHSALHTPGARLRPETPTSPRAAANPLCLLAPRACAAAHPASTTGDWWRPRGLTPFHYRAASSGRPHQMRSRSHAVPIPDVVMSPCGPVPADAVPSPHGRPTSTRSRPRPTSFGRSSTARGAPTPSFSTNPPPPAAAPFAPSVCSLFRYLPNPNRKNRYWNPRYRHFLERIGTQLFVKNWIETSTEVLTYSPPLKFWWNRRAPLGAPMHMRWLHWRQH